MSTEREYRYLNYIHDSIRRIQDRTVGGREVFFQDELLQDAVLRRLETLADAAQHLSIELQTRNAEIPWRTISDFRNRVVHGYLNIDLERVWDVIETDLPPLDAVVEQELRRKARDLDE